MLLPSYYVPQNAYLQAEGLRADVAKYLVSLGIHPSSVTPHLHGLGVMTTQALANICWPNGNTIVPGGPSIHVEVSSGGKSELAKVITGPVTALIQTLDLPAPEGSEKSIWNPIALVEDATREAIIDAVADSMSTILISTEGSIALPLLRKSGATLIKLGDGEGLNHARRSQAVRIAIGTEKRFSLQVQTQPGPFTTHAAYLRSLEAEGGLQNRTYFSLTPSYAPNPIERIDPNHRAVRACAARAMELITETINQIQRKAVRPKVKLSMEATEFLAEITREARQAAMSEPRTYLRNYLFRHAERALREAGVHHLFEYGATGEISISTMQFADRMSRESFAAFNELTYDPPKQTKLDQYAARLEAFIRYQVQFWGLKNPSSLRDLKRGAVNAGLTPTQVTMAVPRLCVEGKIFVEGDKLHVLPGLFSGSNLLGRL